MASTNKWVNDDGLPVTFGNYWADNERPGDLNHPSNLEVYGAFKEIVLPFDFTKLTINATNYPADLNNDGTVDGFTGEDIVIPAGAIVDSVKFYVSEAGAGGAGAAVSLGLFQADGTAIDADGLMTASAGAIANYTLGAVSGSGAVIGKTPSATLDAHIAFVTANASLTAGKGFVLIRYVDKRV